MPRRGEAGCLVCGRSRSRGRLETRRGIRKPLAFKRFKELGIRVSRRHVFLGGDWREYSDTMQLCVTCCPGGPALDAIDDIVKRKILRDVDAGLKATSPDQTSPTSCNTWPISMAKPIQVGFASTMTPVNTVVATPVTFQIPPQIPPSYLASRPPPIHLSDEPSVGHDSAMSVLDLQRYFGPNDSLVHSSEALASSPLFQVSAEELRLLAATSPNSISPTLSEALHQIADEDLLAIGIASSPSVFPAANQ